MYDKEPCFPTFEGRCVSYGGRTFPFLKIERGDSVDNILEKIAESIPETSESVSQTADLSILEGITSICANKIKNKSFSYGIDTSRNTGNFYYNYENTVESISTDLNIVRTEVEVINNSFNSNTLKGSVGGATFPISDFPLRVTFKIDVAGECGLVQLRREAVVTLDKNEVSTEFEVKDFGDNVIDEPIEFKRSLEILAETLKSIDSKFNTKIAILEEENRRLRKLIE